MGSQAKQQQLYSPLFFSQDGDPDWASVVVKAHTLRRPPSLWSATLPFTKQIGNWVDIFAKCP